MLEKLIILGIYHAPMLHFVHLPFYLPVIVVQLVINSLVCHIKDPHITRLLDIDTSRLVKSLGSSTTLVSPVRISKLTKTYVNHLNLNVGCKSRAISSSSASSGPPVSFRTRRTAVVLSDSCSNP
jgi:hypothetical protein